MGSNPTTVSVNTSVQHYLELSRPFNAVAALLSCAVGFVFYNPSSNWFIVGFGLLVVLILHSVFTVQNDVYDLEIDIANKRKNAFTEQKISKASLERFILCGIVAALGVSIYQQQKLSFLAFIGLYSLVAWSYNAPPFSLSRRPVWSIIILVLFYALLPLVFGLKLSGNGFSGMFYLLCLAMSLQRFSISMLKDYKDVFGDKKFGKNTFLLVYGHRMTAIISLSFCMAGYVGVFFVLSTMVPAEGSISLYAALSALALLAILNTRRRLGLVRTTDNKALATIFRQSFVAENQFNLLLILCLAIS